MLRRCILVTFAVGLLTLATTVFAIPPPIVVRIEPPAKPVPSHLYVPTGAIVRFEGPIKSAGRDVPIALWVGSDVRVSGKFNDEWHLEWDPAKEKYPHNTITLSFTATNGNEVRFARIVVDTLDKVPFKMVAQGSTDNIDGSLALKIEATGDIQADHFEMLLDDKPLGIPIDGKGQGTVNLSKQKPGLHKLNAQVVVTDGGTFSLEPLDVSIAAKVHLAPLSTPKVDLRDGKVPPTFILRVVSDDPKIKAESVVYYLDERRLGKGDTISDQELRYTPQRLFSGEHRIYGDITSVDGQHFLSADLTFVVLRDLRGELLDWREHVQQDTEAYDRLLSSALATAQGPVIDLVAAVPIWTQLRVESHDMSRKIRQYPLPGVTGTQRETLQQAMQYYSGCYAAWEEASRAFLAYMRILERYNGNPHAIPRDNVSEITRVSEAYSKYTAQKQEAYNQLGKAETAVVGVARSYGIR